MKEHTLRTRNTYLYSHIVASSLDINQNKMKNLSLQLRTEPEYKDS